MRALIFIIEIFRKFPLMLIANILLVVAMSAFASLSLLIISPIIDFLVNPALRDVGPLTQKAVQALKFFHLPVTLQSWLVIFVVFTVLNSVFEIFARRSILKTKYAVLRDVMYGAFKDFFDAQWYFFSSGKQGVLLNTFTRELILVGDAFGAMALFFASILQTIFYLAVPVFISWQVTIVSVGFGLLCVVPFLLLGRISYRLGVLNTSSANKTISVIHENLSMAKVVLGFSNQRKANENLKEAFDATCRTTLKSQTLEAAIPILYRPFGILVVIFALFASQHFRVPLPEAAVLILALRQVVASIGAVTTQKNSLENFFPSYEQIKQLRKRAGQLKQKSGTRPFDGFSRELHVEKVTFAYPGHEPVFTDISAQIPKGKMVAFVGESGTGKTTFIDMIMGFHQPANGRITIDGVPLEDFDIHSYRQRVGYVPQDSVLFNMTIRDNLLWSYEAATDKETIEACRQANADEFIRQLPEGYNTLVGDRGVRLSGGQVQRIALARAILRKPEILILDEATSSLDTYSERLIQQAIEKIAKETTVIVIAHRLSTIVNSDYVYVLKKGRIIEEGTYPELAQREGYFNNMIKLQALEAGRSI